MAEAWSSGRPLAGLSFALNRWAGLDSPAGFRIPNVLLHLGTALLLYFLLRLLALAPAARGAEEEDGRFVRWFPAAAALLWAVNPTHTETVTYIVQRMNGAMTFFFLASLLVFFRGVASPRPWGWYALSAVFGSLALGFKENALLLPYFCALGYVLFLKPAAAPEEERRSGRTAAVPGLAVLAVLSVILVWRARGLALLSLAAYDGSLARFLLSVARVVPYYAGLFLLPLPSRLHLNYEHVASAGLFSPPGTAVGLLTLAAAAAAIAWSWKRDRWIAFGLGWFLGGILPESLLPSLDLVFEHRLYLSSVGLVVAGLRGLYLLVRLAPARRAGLAAASAALAVAFLSVSHAVFAYQRNRVWADPGLFWTHELAMAPGSANAVIGKMVDLIGRKSYSDAVILGEAFLGRGSGGREARDVYTNLAIARAGLKDWGRVAGILEKSVGAWGERKFEVYNLGVAYFELGRRDAAAKSFERVLALDPGNPDALYYLGLVRTADGDNRAAARMFEGALSSKPRDVETLVKLVDAYSALNDWESAARAAERLASVPGESDSPARWFQSGYVYLRAKRIDKAESEWGKYLAAFPGDPAANFNMACLFSLKGDQSRSLQFLERSLAGGFRDRALVDDGDLEAVRGTPGFRRLLRKYRIHGGTHS